MAKTLVYEMSPRTWNGIKEMKEHLFRIVKLGVDYVWLTPMYPSPGFDYGYDVSNYKAIDSRFGTMDEFDDFVSTAHSLGIGVLMDLVLNHTSITHPWFKEKPSYYCWSDKDRTEWHNLFDDGSAWEKYRSDDPTEEDERGYYLHLFSKEQADLNWFHGDEINPELVEEFQDIVWFWLNFHDIDGFRLDAPQCLNKDLDEESMDINELLSMDGGMECIVNAIFGDPHMTTWTTWDDKPPFIIAEYFDPTPVNILSKCAEATPQIDYFMNPLIKDAITEKNGYKTLDYCIRTSVMESKFMLNLESHDTPRFPSLSGLPSYHIIDLMFESGAEGICLYQGQELGLTNPVWIQMTDEDMLELDAMTAMLYKKGEDLHELRKFSRANARVHLPLTEYPRQEGIAGSVLEHTKAKIRAWKSIK